MDAGLAVILGLGGFIGYNVLKDTRVNANQPNANQKMPSFSDWFNGGSQPQTGNGAPKTDIQGISQAVSDVSKFATSLAGFFGTASSSGSGSDGAGIGAGSNQIQTYSDGGGSYSDGGF